MQFTIERRPTEEIVTLNEVKSYLKIDDDYENDILELLIKSTREAIEAIIQKSVISQVWRYEVNMNNLNDCYHKKIGSPDLNGGYIKISLPKPPIIKILSLTSNGKEISEENYSLERENTKFCLCFFFEKVIRKKSMFPIVITYEAGIADSAKNVPYQLKLANLMLIANAYQERYSYDHTTIISKDVKQLLGPFLNLHIF